jgi:hypothetical protein
VSSPSLAIRQRLPHLILARVGLIFRYTARYNGQRPAEAKKNYFLKRKEMVDRYQFGLLFESIENRVLQHRRNLLTGKCEGYFSCIKSRGRLKTCVGGSVEIYVKDLQGSAFDTKRQSSGSVFLPSLRRLSLLASTSGYLLPATCLNRWESILPLQNRGGPSVTGLNATRWCVVVWSK